MTSQDKSQFCFHGLRCKNTKCERSHTIPTPFSCYSNCACFNPDCTLDHSFFNEPCKYEQNGKICKYPHCPYIHYEVKTYKVKPYKVKISKVKTSDK
jgi:hypothetical protein